MKKKMLNQKAYNPHARGRSFSPVKQSSSDKLKNLTKLMGKKDG